MKLDFSRLDNFPFIGDMPADDEPLNISQSPPPWVDGYDSIDAGQGADEPKSKALIMRELSGIVLAFKEICWHSKFKYQAREDSKGRPRVEVIPTAESAGPLALAAARERIAQDPQLEAALLIELSKRDETLRDILEERAAIRAADNLPDDPMTIALLTIGADPAWGEAAIPTKATAPKAPAAPRRTRSKSKPAA